MALFKIEKGLAANLAQNRPKANEGWAYFTSDDGKFYIDISGTGTENAVLGRNRIVLNAGQADKVIHSYTLFLDGEAQESFNGSKNIEIDITPAAIHALDKRGDTATGTMRFNSAVYLNTETYADSITAKNLLVNGAARFVNGLIGNLTGNADTATRLNITSTDNAIARFDGTNGTIQNSRATIDDTGNVIFNNSDGGDVTLTLKRGGKTYWTHKVSGGNYSLWDNSDQMLFWHENSQGKDLNIYAPVNIGTSSTNRKTTLYGDLHTTGYSIFDDYVNIGTSGQSEYKLYVNGITFLNGKTYSNGDITIGSMNGDTVVGAGNFKIGVKNDSYGVMPYANNWNSIGSSSLYWYRAYINHYYGNTSHVTNWDAGKNIGTAVTDGAAAAPGTVYFYNAAAVGITQTKTLLSVNSETNTDITITLPNVTGTLLNSGNYNDYAIAKPTSSTDNAIVRWDGVDGKHVQNSGVTIDDSNNVDGVNKLTITNRGANAHIQFSRASYNYLLYPSGGTIAIGGAANGTGTHLAVDNVAVFPGQNNKTINLGTSSYYWNNIYGNCLYISDAYNYLQRGILVLDTDASNPSNSAGARIKFSYGNGLQPVYISYTPNDSYRAPYGLKIFGSDGTAPGAWLEVEGNLYIGSASNANSNNNSALYIRGMSAIEGFDSWLRLNDNSSFSSGTYSPKLIRSDEALQVGSGGANFYANSSGNGYFSNTLGIAGTNTGYKLYVNGTTGVSNYIYRAYASSNQTPMIWMNAGDTDNYLFQISSGTTTKQYYGYGLKYIGSKSGVENFLRLYADNQNGTDQIAIAFNQNGQVGIKGDADANFSLYVNGASRFNGATDITGNLTVTAAGITKLQNTTDSNNSQDSNAALAIQGGVSVAKQLSAKTVRIDGSSSDATGSTTQGCTINFNKTTNCIEFVFD